MVDSEFDQELARRFSELNPTNPFQRMDGGMGFNGRFPSMTDSGRSYHVVVTPSSMYCECRGWMFNRRCSHIDTIKAALDADADTE